MNSFDNVQIEEVAYEPTAADWAEYEEYLDSLENAGHDAPEFDIDPPFDYSEDSDDTLEVFANGQPEWQDYRDDIFDF